MSDQGDFLPAEPQSSGIPALAHQDGHFIDFPGGRDLRP